jgi:flagellar biosynthesis/type III secretory pathway M-ring protein FliF/YscJ
MMIESMALEGQYVISLMLTPTERWKAARSFSDSSSTEGLIPLLAVIALIIAIVLFFCVYAKYKRSKQCLNLKNNELTTTNEKLQQEEVELNSNVEIVSTD